MKYSEMTPMQKLVLSSVKEHLLKDEYTAKFTNGLKLISMIPAAQDKHSKIKRESFGTSYYCKYPNKDKDDWTTCIRVDYAFLRLIVKCSFKARKYENNVVYTEVVMYSDGTIACYFDGTEYERI